MTCFVMKCELAWIGHIVSSNQLVPYVAPFWCWSHCPSCTPSFVTGFGAAKGRFSQADGPETNIHTAGFDLMSVALCILGIEFVMIGCDVLLHCLVQQQGNKDC